MYSLIYLFRHYSLKSYVSLKFKESHLQKAVWFSDKTVMLTFVKHSWTFGRKHSSAMATPWDKSEHLLMHAN